jgi:hypothetical protein
LEIENEGFVAEDEFACMMERPNVSEEVGKLSGV